MIYSQASREKKDCLAFKPRFAYHWDSSFVFVQTHFLISGRIIQAATCTFVINHRQNVPTNSRAALQSKRFYLCRIMRFNVVLFSSRTYKPTTCTLHFTERVSTEGNAIPSIRPSFRVFPLYLSNRLTFGLDLLHVCGGHYHGSQGI